MITIKKITPEQTYDIRQEVLRKGIDLPSEFQGDSDEHTFHLGGFVEDELIGVSSFMKTSNSQFSEPQYQLRGMATLEKARGMGCGKLMLNYAIKMLIEKKTTILWCNAREVALNFYLKQNFKIKGGSYRIPNIGVHYCMYIRLS